jgi:hypothetical protein
MKNSYLMGNDLYPMTVSDVLRVLDYYEKEWTGNLKAAPMPTPTTTRKTGAAFTMMAGGVKLEYLRGSNNSFFANITCNLCKIQGHYQSHCPVATKAGSKIGAGSEREEEAEAAVEEVSVRCGVLLNNHTDSSQIPSSPGYSSTVSPRIIFSATSGW